VDFLVRAAHHIVHVLGRQDIQFLLMGTGPEYSGLLQLRSELQLIDHMDMPGRVTNEFLFSALQTMDLGVSSDPINPYNHHCTMNKVLEYMTFGKAQVLFDLKEGRASAGQAAHYVSENSPEALAQGIVCLIDNPEMRQEMGLVGRERMATQLHWNQSVRNLLKAYQAAQSVKY
jgi:glycosyltransferase involved in cell wall biosynthesis